MCVFLSRIFEKAVSRYAVKIVKKLEAGNIRRILLGSAEKSCRS